MNTPVVEFSTASLAQQETAQTALHTLVRNIVLSLRQPPHFVLLKGVAPTDDRRLTAHIARIIANAEPVKPNTTPEQRQKMSFTKVLVDPEKAKGNASATAYSRTHKPLELHTDSSYKREPHELVAFQMVRADAGGGDTLMLPVEAVLQMLDREVISTLARPIFDFGKGPLPILWRRDDAIHIRYYRTQIEESAATISHEALAAMDALDKVLEDESQMHRFRIEAGETLFMHNTKVLHGRTGFEETSNRLMYRIRMQAGCLG